MEFLKIKIINFFKYLNFKKKRFFKENKQNQKKNNLYQLIILRETLIFYINIKYSTKKHLEKYRKFEKKKKNS